jgi:membrane-bound lytic murein transglycosylase F
MIVIVAGWPEPRALYGADLPEIQKRGTLRVVVWNETIPELYATHPSSQPGFEAEILQGYAELSGLKLELVTVPTLAGRIPALLDGRGDVAAGGVASTRSRREQVAFSEEIFPILHAAINLKPNLPIETLEQLRKERVGTVKASSWSELALAAGVPKANLDDGFTSVSDMLGGLRTRRISATVLSVRIAILEQRRDPNIQIGLSLGEPTSGAFALRKDAPRLLESLDGYILNLRRTASWNRLVVKYFGASALDALKRSRAK